jgi:osmotically-inducible protein OsmY
MTRESQQSFANFALVARVHAALALSPEMATATLDIKAQDGRVAISGVIPSWVSEDEVVRKVKKVSGVQAVSAELVNSPPDLSLNT